MTAALRIDKFVLDVDSIRAARVEGPWKASDEGPWTSVWVAELPGPIAIPGDHIEAITAALMKRKTPLQTLPANVYGMATP